MKFMPAFAEMPDGTEFHYQSTERWIIVSMEGCDQVMWQLPPNCPLGQFDEFLYELAADIGLLVHEVKHRELVDGIAYCVVTSNGNHEVQDKALAEWILLMDHSGLRQALMNAPTPHPATLGSLMLTQP